MEGNLGRSSDGPFLPDLSDLEGNLEDNSIILLHFCFMTVTFALHPPLHSRYIHRYIRVTSTVTFALHPPLHSRYIHRYIRVTFALHHPLICSLTCYFVSTFPCSFVQKICEHILAFLNHFQTIFKPFPNRFRATSRKKFANLSVQFRVKNL